MNRIATRAMIVLFLVLALAGGLVFFLGAYLTEGADWVMFSGSPHVYKSGELSNSTIVDRNGVLLMRMDGSRTYDIRICYRFYI